MTLSKRIFDLFFTSLGLLVLWPLLLLVVIIIKLTDGGQVFFRQERVGLKGKRFRIWKFRTMVPNAEQIGQSLTVGRDPRITPIGHWLRKSKLDELPQLFNVMTGEMSLVGPRPEVPKYVQLYPPQLRPVLDRVPGITDPASIRYRDENDVLASAVDPERVYIDTIMPEKARINLDYAARASVATDFVVIFQTFGKLVKH